MSLILFNEHQKFRPDQKNLLEKVANRVADSGNLTIREGPTQLFGNKLFLPIGSSDLSYAMLEGIATFEASHIRFKSVKDPALGFKICEKDPEFGNVLIKMCDDYRITHLLQEQFPGFAQEFDQITKNGLDQLIQNLEQSSSDMIQGEHALELLLAIIWISATHHDEYFFHSALCIDGKFKFASLSLGTFYIALQDAWTFLRKEKSFIAAILTAKRIYNAIEQYFEPPKPELPPPPPADPLPDSKSDQNQTKGDKKEDSESSTEVKDKGEKSEKSSDQGDSDNNFEPKMDFEKEFQEKDENNLSPLNTPITENGSKGSLSERLDQGFDSSKITENYGFSSELNGLNRGELRRSERNHLDAVSEILGKIDPKRASDLDNFKEKNEKKLKKILQKERVELDHNSGSILPVKYLKNEFSNEKPDLTVIPIKESDGVITAKLIRNQRELEKLSRIHNPVERYQQIIRNHTSLINDLKVQFNPIQKTKTFQRGARRGILSSRDLSLVKSSKGVFNRPFKGLQTCRGAQLLVLIDESGSMYTSNHIGLAKEACITLGEALKGTQIQFAVIGFAALYGKSTIAEKIYKDFDSPLNASLLGCIGISDTYNVNRDGTSILTAAKYHFKNNLQNVPIMIIISDGFPNHGGTSYVGENAIEQTRNAFKEVQSLGVKVFVLSVDQGGTSYLTRIYGTKRHVIMRNPALLQKYLIDLVKEIGRALIGH